LLPFSSIYPDSQKYVGGLDAFTDTGIIRCRFLEYMENTLGVVVEEAGQSAGDHLVFHRDSGSYPDNIIIAAASFSRIRRAIGIALVWIKLAQRGDNPVTAVLAGFELV